MNDLLHDFLQIRSDLFYGVGLALAIAVTLHALLRKREVASTVGWIGLVWFAPITGAIAYALFGINRVRARAQEMMPPDPARQSAAPPPAMPEPHSHLAPLARGVATLTARPLLPDNAIRTLHDGDEAYPVMLDAIAAARHTIGLSSFIFRDDAWGGRFIDALIAAHRRGVAVRVLIDGIGGGWIRSPAWRRLRRNEVPAARFLHSVLPWRMPFLNLRSHKKILVIDGTMAFTGGLNIGDENVLADRPAHPVQDTHFQLHGPIIAQLSAAFAEDWAFATREALAGPAWFPPLSPAGDAPARVIDSGPDADLEKIEFAVMQAIAAARHRIAILTPYFLPDERLATALCLAAQRGVAVDVIVPAENNHRLIAWAFQANSTPLLQHGVRLWRSPPPFRHSKIMVVDGVWSLVGSCNWDIRSFRLNFEICTELYDPALAAELEAMLARYREAPWTEAELTARPLWMKLRDAAARLMSPYL